MFLNLLPRLSKSNPSRFCCLEQVTKVEKFKWEWLVLNILGIGIRVLNLIYLMNSFTCHKRAKSFIFQSHHFCLHTYSQMLSYIFVSFILLSMPQT